MHTRSPWLTRANGLTSLRLLAAPALAVAICADASVAAAALVALAIATDFADGVVARRFDEQSGLGRLIDHATDAVFVTTGTAALAFEGVLPAPLPTLIAVSFLQYALDSRSSLPAGPRPSRLGRWNGIAYYAIVAVPIARDALGLHWPAAGFVAALGWLLVASSLISISLRLCAARSRAPTTERARGWRDAGRAARSPR